MGYLIGGKSRHVIASASDEDFKLARSNEGAGMTFTKVDDIMPIRHYGDIARSQALKANQKAFGSGTSFDVSRNAPLFNDPRYTSSTLAVPTDERTLHGLYRFFTETDPIIGTAVRLHSEMPLAGLGLGQCEDSGVQQHFEDMWERINGIKLLNDMATEHYEIGNCFAPNATLTMPKGRVPIQDIKLGDPVLTHKGRFKQVISNSRRLIDETAYRIDVAKLPSFKNNVVTKEHPFLVYRRGKQKWVPAQYLVSGDYVAIGYVQRHFYNVPEFYLVDDLQNNDKYNVIQNNGSLVVTSSQKWRQHNYEDSKLAKTRILNWLSNLECPITMTKVDAAKILDLPYTKFTSALEYVKQKYPIKVTSRMKSKYSVETSGMNASIWHPYDKRDYHDDSFESESTVTFKSSFNKITVTKEFMYLLGYWLGDGCVIRWGADKARLYGAIGQGKIWNIVFNKTEIKNQHKVINAIKKCFGIDVVLEPSVYNPQNYDSTPHINITNPIFASWWSRQFGFDCESKLLPDWVFGLSTEYKLELLRGLFDSDGHYSVRNNVTAVLLLKNGNLLNQILLLSNELGIPFGFKQNKRGYYVLSVAGMPFVKKIIKNSVKESRVKDNDYKPYRKSGERFIYIDGQYFYKIRNIEDVQYKGYVHNVQVEDDESYVVDGVCTHNCYIFGAWNESDYMWEQFAVLNPDYVKIEGTWVNDQPLIKLIPDEVLKRIVQNESPEFLYRQLPPSIVQYVLMNREIPLDPNNVFHLSHAKRPYELKGKSPIKRVLKLLMLEDRFNQANFALATRHAVPFTVVKMGDPKNGWLPSSEEMDAVREAVAAHELDPNFCYDEETECLTRDGWKHYTELTYHDKVAAFDPKTNGLRYDEPDAITVQDYDGDMYRFDGIGFDMKVTPNHRMWLRRGGEWQIQHADKVKTRDMFRAVVDQYDGEHHDVIEVAGQTVDAGDFFELVGWYVAEGNIANYGHDKPYGVVITQTHNGHRDEVRVLFDKLPWGCNHTDKHDKFTINNQKLAQYFEDNFGRGSENKKLPRWMLDASKLLLDRLFKAWLLGDGNERDYSVEYWQGCSTSEQLIDQMQEMAFKLGYATRKRKKLYNQHTIPTRGVVDKRVDGTDFLDVWMLIVTNGQRLAYPQVSKRTVKKSIEIGAIDHDGDKLLDRRYKVDWDVVDLPELLETAGSFRHAGELLGVQTGTIINRAKRDGIHDQFVEQFNNVVNTKRNGVEHVSRSITKEHYVGKIWCVSVPTGIIVTRRNGKVAIQGQTLIFHYGIDIQYYGASGKTLPVGPELDRIYKLKMIGLGIHEQLMTGAGGTYAQAYINLEVQRQRYLNLQLKLDNIVHAGWFKVVADLCGFYRVKKALSGPTGTKSYSWGSGDRYREHLKQQFSTIRDTQDNKEFYKFLDAKAKDWQKRANQELREYVYPELDWGQLSAASDENQKNYIKWLTEKRPWLVDDATLSRLAKLDRDEQEKAYLEDLRRKRDRWLKISKEKLTPYIETPGEGGPAGIGVGIPAAPPGAMGDLPFGAEEPAAPVGEGGPPEAATGEVPPAPPGGVESMLKSISNDIVSGIVSDDVAVSNENVDLKKQKHNHKISVRNKRNGNEKDFKKD